jgi:hypothetical protein
MDGGAWQVVAMIDPRCAAVLLGTPWLGNGDDKRQSQRCAAARAIAFLPSAEEVSSVLDHLCPV